MPSSSGGLPCETVTDAKNPTPNQAQTPATDLPEQLHTLAWFNPLSGIFSLYRSAFFPDQFDPIGVAIAAGMSLAIFGIGLFVFKRSERSVLKEI